MVIWFKGDRRKKYRVEPERAGVVGVNLVLSNGRLLAGDLINISLDGSAIFFPAHQCPDLAPNQRVKLKFLLTKATKSVLVDATVKDLCAVGKSKFCRCQFREPDRLLQQLDPSLLKYFNRRQGFRMEPGEDEPIEVMLEWHGGFAQGRIIDLSTTGMGLEIDPELAQTLGPAELLTLSFQLPGSKIPSKLVGSIAYRKPRGENTHCGIRFDWNWRKTENFELQESTIGAYLIRRKREIDQKHSRKKKS